MLVSECEELHFVLILEALFIFGEVVEEGDEDASRALFCFVGVTEEGADAVALGVKAVEFKSCSRAGRDDGVFFLERNAGADGGDVAAVGAVSSDICEGGGADRVAEGVGGDAEGEGECFIFSVSERDVGLV